MKSYVAFSLIFLGLAGCGVAEPDVETSPPIKPEQEMSPNKDRQAPALDPNAVAPADSSDESLTGPPAEVQSGTSCRCTPRCSLWAGSAGTYYNGRFLYCGC